jgi:N-acetylglucosaminyl-diphospho-decaprenol L-rhamnosyltransferase
MHDLGIVIVNWNTRDLLKRCLETVITSEGDFSLQVVVVDNASTDGSDDMVREQFMTAAQSLPQTDSQGRAEHHRAVHLIITDSNGGYSYANNFGLRWLGYRGPGDVDPESPRYALLLNPDTEVPPDALYKMLTYMDAHPEVGMAGPKLVLPDGSLDKACRRSFPTPLVSFYHFAGLAKRFPNSPRFARYNLTYLPEDQETEVDSVVGAYMQVRKEVVAQVGLLDETFFMYGEDLDWAYRAKSAGWKVMYHPQVTVKHVKRAASRRSKKAQFEFYRAMLIFYRKHYRKTTPLLLHGLVLTALMLKGGPSLWLEMRRPQAVATSI